MTRVCDRIGCEEEAAMAPLLEVHPDPPQKGLAYVDTGLHVCLRHMEDTTLEVLMDDEDWDMIVAMFASQNLPPPERAATELRWVPLPMKAGVLPPPGAKAN